MGSTEKKINKWLIGAIIWWAVVGASALSATKKGQSFWQRIFSKAKWFVETAIEHGEKLGGGKR